MSLERAGIVTLPHIGGATANLLSRYCGRAKEWTLTATNLLRGAGFVVLEQNQSSPVSGTRCRPGITVLDTHRQPLAFIEIVRSNRPSNSYHVAGELNIPLFTILAPHRRSLVPGLQPSRPWWDFDPTLPEDTTRQMYFMEQVADELMRRSGEGDSTWSSLDRCWMTTGISHL